MIELVKIANGIEVKNVPVAGGNTITVSIPMNSRDVTKYPSGVRLHGENGISHDIPYKDTQADGVTFDSRDALYEWIQNHIISPNSGTGGDGSAKAPIKTIMANGNDTDRELIFTDSQGHQDVDGLHIGYNKTNETSFINDYNETKVTGSLRIGKGIMELKVDNNGNPSILNIGDKFTFNKIISGLDGVTTTDMATVGQLNTLAFTKVDKVSGKDLTSNDFTDELKTKLEGLESSHFRGRYNSLADLNAVVGESGDYAYVLIVSEEYPNGHLLNYIWDAVENEWTPSIDIVQAETPSTIKTKYESNPDTNPFSDSEKHKLASLSNYNDVPLRDMINNKVDKESDKGLSSNDFTNVLRDKLIGLEGTHFRGKHLDIDSLNSVPNKKSGDYAFLEADINGSGTKVLEQFIWDVAKDMWRPSVTTPTEETPASILQKLTMNDGIEAFKTTDKTKLDAVATTYVPVVRKINGQTLDKDINITYNDLSDANIPIGTRNYIDNGNFVKGQSLWKFRNDLESVVNVLPDTKFGNILDFKSNVYDSGPYHIMIGNELEEDQWYTMSFWMKLNSDDIQESRDIKIGWQGLVFDKLKSYTATKVWKLFKITEKYEFGNANPRFYGEGHFQLANISLVTGKATVDYCPSPSDLSYPDTVVNQFHSPSRWDALTNINSEVIDNGTVKFTLIDPTKDGIFASNGIDNIGNYRIQTTFETSGVTNISVVTGANRVTLSNHIDKATITGEPEEPRRSVVHYTLPDKFNSRLDILCQRDTSWPVRINYILSKDSPTKSVIIKYPSYYKTVTYNPWSINQLELVSRLVYLENKIKELESKLP